MNLLDILSTSPPYFCTKWVGQKMRIQMLILGFKELSSGIQVWNKTEKNLHLPKKKAFKVHINFRGVSWSLFLLSFLINKKINKSLLYREYFFSIFRYSSLLIWGSGHDSEPHKDSALAQSRAFVCHCDLTIFHLEFVYCIWNGLYSFYSSINAGLGNMAHCIMATK